MTDKKANQRREIRHCSGFISGNGQNAKGNSTDCPCHGKDPHQMEE